MKNTEMVQSRNWWTEEYKRNQTSIFFFLSGDMQIRRR
ncbi:hypothetical protein M513_06704 [Trichuris suis]|uniref:Uncharacterized protein n=1 Tax=Trichuris suis TaxID=68888 RepID=A0A085M527_9BILA|nr:hypothetical protein M513_06704 [Trichuris suis]